VVPPDSVQWCGAATLTTDADYTAHLRVVPAHDKSTLRVALCETCVLKLAAMHAAYATWVVEGPRTPDCYNFHNRDVDMRAMVYLSWGFIVLNW
jgi:hypothetical protein